MGSQCLTACGTAPLGTGAVVRAFRRGLCPHQWAVIALLGLTLAAYAPVWTFGWLYDDLGWLPLTETTQPVSPGARVFWIAEWLGGGLPWAYHGLILGLHLLNGWFLWALARRWMAPLGATVALLLFWLHPVQREAVAYVSGGVEVLLTTYGLIAALGLVCGGWLGLSVAGLALWLAVTLKPSAMALLLVVPWLHRRGWMAVVGGSLWAAWHWGASAQGWITASAHTVGDVTAWAAAVLRYLAFIVWPVGFSLEHDWRAVTPLVGGLCLVALGWLMVWAWRWMPSRLASLAVLAFLVPRLAVPNAPPLTEHHTYLAFLAVWLMVGAAVEAIHNRGTTWLMPVKHSI